MGGILDEKAMDTKIKNAFYSVGVEEGFRHGFKRPDLEFKAITLKARNLTIDQAGHQEVKVEELLNAGWWLTDKIICPRYVMLIFGRGKESEDNGE